MNDERIQQLLTYRNDLVRLTESSQRDFDQQVLALSGTAFGLAFAFADKFIPENCTPLYDFLFGAFASWTLSILAVLASFFFSVQALRRVTTLVDKAVQERDEKELSALNPGGWRQTATESANIFAGFFFLAGVVLTVLFVAVNRPDADRVDCRAPASSEIVTARAL